MEHKNSGQALSDSKACNIGTKSKAEQLYDAHHNEFETWFNSIHPNHGLTFQWEYVYDSGWYKEGTVNGAWIAWLALTCKNTTSGTRK